MQVSQWWLPVILCLPVYGQAGTLSAPVTPVQFPAPVKLVAAESATYPTRGMSMQQVKQKHGQPHSVRVSKGRDKKRWPRITVWNYGQFSVYFERNRVLHTVVH